ncbi:endodeoxyribonuclease [Serendipita sp. 399]|nr:endodeoxyribonuclease [Serendipita sp. 399]
MSSLDLDDDSETLRLREYFQFPGDINELLTIFDEDESQHSIADFPMDEGDAFWDLIEEEEAEGVSTSSSMPGFDAFDALLDDEDDDKIETASSIHAEEELELLIQDDDVLFVESMEFDGADELFESDEEEDSPRTQLISQLEGFLLSVLTQFAECTEGTKRQVILELADRRKPLAQDGTYQTRRSIFPRMTSSGCSLRAIVIAFAVVTYVHEALVTQIPVTKRDIYYRNVDLFKKQAVVDNMVDDLAATFAVTRDELFVRASSKGIFCGSALSLRLEDGTVIAGNDCQPTIIPPGDNIEELIIEEDIAWIMVIEKEAVFQTLCKVGFARKNRFGRPGICLTGKGYPDLVTRQLLHKLSTGLPQEIPIFAVVDADPYGVDILATYAFGSRSFQHEREGLVSERLIWLGVKPSQLESLDIPAETLLNLSARDENKVKV